jgi:hypothetical protein
MASPTANELTLTQVVYGSEKADDEFGSALALSNDGKRLVVGARSENGQAGAIRIYEQNGGTWELMKGGLVAGKNPEVRAGWAVSISADGNGKQINECWCQRHFRWVFVYIVVDLFSLNFHFLFLSS